MMYTARCKHGLIVAAALANTPLEQAEAAPKVKRWAKKYAVALESPVGNEYVWCLATGRSKCKKCRRQDREFYATQATKSS